MDPLVLVLRLLHVGFGVFWAGAMMFTTFLLLPALSDAGPAGGPVMAGLQKRRMMEILPVVALITILSGFWLYGRTAADVEGWAGSPVGIALGTGGLLATIALLLGVVIVRPVNVRAAALMAGMAQIPEGSERSAQLATVQRLRERGTFWSRIVAGLIILTTGLMAVARYL